MSQVQRLEALLRQKEHEKQEIMSQLSRARTSRSSATAAALDFESVPGNYQIAPSRPVLADNGRSRSNTIPRSVTAAPGIAAADSVSLQLDHVQSQVSNETPRPNPLFCSCSPMVPGPEPSHEAFQDHTQCRSILWHGHGEVQLKYVHSTRCPQRQSVGSQFGHA